MSEWLPIETAPKDECILLFWPAYAYSLDDPDVEPSIAIGRWKTNSRISREGSSDIVRDYNMAASYFSDTSEMDDYGLAQTKHAPTHWMPLPKPPQSE